MKKKDDEEDDDTAIEVQCSERCQAWHSVNSTAAIMNLTRRTVYRLMAEGELSYVEPCIGRRIHHQEINRYLKSKTAAAIDKSVCAVPKRGRPKKVEPETFKDQAPTTSR